MKNECLTFRNVSFSYSSSGNFFQDFSFSLFPGEFVVFAGCNGCGKSTFMRLASGILEPHRGQVLLKGRPLKEYSNFQRASFMGFVPQYLPESAGMTVEELVMTGRTGKNAFFGLPIPSSTDFKVVRQVLADMDMTHLAGRSCSSLSGGEFKRASIAAILAQEPEILLLDEPCSFLDYAHGKNLMDKLHLLQKERNISICMVTHELSAASEYASRFVFMKEGRILADGKAEEILLPDILEKVYSCPFEILEDSKGNKVPVAKSCTAVQK